MILRLRRRKSLNAVAKKGRKGTEGKGTEENGLLNNSADCDKINILVEFALNGMNSNG